MVTAFYYLCQSRMRKDITSAENTTGLSTVSL
jgi:hypothetical protein